VADPGLNFGDGMEAVKVQKVHSTFATKLAVKKENYGDWGGGASALSHLPLDLPLSEPSKTLMN